ncbi:hypothetical protein FACS1894219_00640 [Clostridia bacterium]|nr:hypothetical protein FACS1894219_00640 [Clostridia bacterium]
MTSHNKKENNLLRNSLVFRFIFAVADLLYIKIARSAAAFIFTGYDKCEQIFRQSFIYRLFTADGSKNIKPFFRGIKKRIMEASASSGIYRIVGNIIDAVARTALGTIGAFLSSFGFYSVVVYLLKLFVFESVEFDIVQVFISAALTSAGILCIIKRKQTLRYTVANSVIIAFIFNKILGYSGNKIDTPEEISDSGGKVRNVVSFSLGMIVAAAGYFVSPLYLIAGVAALFALYGLLCYPEAGLHIVILGLPFIPTMPLAGLCILTGVCYILKLIRGKRAFEFHLLDLTIIFFAALTLLGGVVAVGKSGSLQPALLYTAFMLIYFVSVNLIRTREQIIRVIQNILIAGFFVAIIGVYQNYSGSLQKIWQDASMFSEIEGRVVSTFENPNVLAEYLVLLIPFVVVLLFSNKNLKGSVMYLTCAFFLLLCLVLTWSRGSWLAFLFSVVILLIMVNRKVLAAYFGALLLIPFAPLLLPENVIARFLSIGNIADSSTSYRVSIWTASLNLIKRYFIEGIGVGFESFRRVYPEFSLAGIESAPHSHSLWLQIMTELGVTGIVVFIFVIFFFVQSCFTSISREEDNKIRLILAAGLVAVIGFLLNGFTDYVWYNYRVFLMFWVVLSVTSAVARYTVKTTAGYSDDAVNSNMQG